MVEHVLHDLIAEAKIEMIGRKRQRGLHHGEGSQTLGDARRGHVNDAVFEAGLFAVLSPPFADVASIGVVSHIHQNGHRVADAASEIEYARARACRPPEPLEKIQMRIDRLLLVGRRLRKIVERPNIASSDRMGPGRRRAKINAIENVTVSSSETVVMTRSRFHAAWRLRRSSGSSYRNGLCNTSLLLTDGKAIRFLRQHRRTPPTAVAMTGMPTSPALPHRCCEIPHRRFKLITSCPPRHRSPAYLAEPRAI